MHSTALCVLCCSGSCALCCTLTVCVVHSSAALHCTLLCCAALCSTVLCVLRYNTRVVVLEGEERDGNEDTDEVLEEAPPTPYFTPPLVAAKGLGQRLSGLPQGSRCPLV